MKKLTGRGFYLFFALFLCMDLAWSDQLGAFMIPNPPEKLTTFFVGAAKKHTNIIVVWKIQDRKFSASAQLADNSTNGLIEPVLSSKPFALQENQSGSPPIQFSATINGGDYSHLELQIIVGTHTEKYSKYTENISVKYRLTYKKYNAAEDSSTEISGVSGTTMAKVSYHSTTQNWNNLVETLKQLVPSEPPSENTSVKADDEHK